MFVSSESETTISEMIAAGYKFLLSDGMITIPQMSPPPRWGCLFGERWVAYQDSDYGWGDTPDGAIADAARKARERAAL